MSNVHILGVSATRINLINPALPVGTTDLLGETVNLPELFTVKIEFDAQATDLPGSEREACHVLFIAPGAMTHPSVVQLFPELQETLHQLLSEDISLKLRRLWIRDSTPTAPEHQTIVYADSAGRRFYHEDRPKETELPKPVRTT